LEPFSRDKLFMSLYESCKHRPTALTDADGLADTVMQHVLQHLNEGVVGREEIAAISTAVLERFDRTAATIYSAYHKV
jgi:transcriptional regulator NrdR family protein